MFLLPVFIYSNLNQSWHINNSLCSLSVLSNQYSWSPDLISFNDLESWQAAKFVVKETTTFWTEMNFPNNCLISQAALWITTLPTLKIQTFWYTTLLTVHWNALNTQNLLVVLSSGVGSPWTRSATQRLLTLEDFHKVEAHLAQWRVGQQEEQASISFSLFKIWRRIFFTRICFGLLNEKECF